MVCAGPKENVLSTSKFFCIYSNKMSNLTFLVVLVLLFH